MGSSLVNFNACHSDSILFDPLNVSLFQKLHLRSLLEGCAFQCNVSMTSWTGQKTICDNFIACRLKSAVYPSQSDSEAPKKFETVTKINKLILSVICVL